MPATPDKTIRTRTFASDNYAGICPEALEAMNMANPDHAQAYGEDDWTFRASDRLRELFEIDCEVFFVFNGTAANSLALGHLCRSYHSVIAHELAHVETDECGGPEFFTHGTKLLLASSSDGKVLPSEVDRLVSKRSDIHYPKPRVISLTQSNEVGLVYTVNELESLHEVARRHRLKIHMDGARFANAVASLGVAPKEITWKVGVDVLCFGGSKNGMAVGEAVIFFDRDMAREFDYRCKQAGQLCSKMRFLSAPWVAMLEDDAWLRHARHANDCAQRLAGGLQAIPGVSLMFPREANAVFVELPAPWIQALRDKGWRFYTFIGAGGCRLMCAWDTQREDVDAFIADVQALAAEVPVV